MRSAFYDPLSFSQASAKGLADIVREALVDLGCPVEKLNDFDQQASITVEVDGMLDIQISVENDRLWVWAALTDLNEERVTQRATAVLSFLVEAVEDVETGQLVLGKGLEGYELKALVSPTCLNRDNGLADVLEQFQRRLEAFCGIVAGVGAPPVGNNTVTDRRINWL